MAEFAALELQANLHGAIERKWPTDFGVQFVVYSGGDSDGDAQHLHAARVQSVWLLQLRANACLCNFNWLRFAGNNNVAICRRVLIEAAVFDGLCYRLRNICALLARHSSHGSGVLLPSLRVSCR